MDSDTGSRVTPLTLPRAAFSCAILRQQKETGCMVDTLSRNSKISSPRVECECFVHSLWLISRKALFRGLGPSLVRAVPSAASTFVAFELTKGEYGTVCADGRLYRETQLAIETRLCTPLASLHIQLVLLPRNPLLINYPSSLLPCNSLAQRRLPPGPTLQLLP